MTLTAKGSNLCIQVIYTHILSLHLLGYVHLYLKKTVGVSSDLLTDPSWTTLPLPVMPSTNSCGPGASDSMKRYRYKLCLYEYKHIHIRIHISYHKPQIKAPCLNRCIRNIWVNFFMICFAYTFNHLHILPSIHMSKLVLAVFGKQLGGATVHHTLLTSRWNYMKTMWDYVVAARSLLGSSWSTRWFGALRAGGSRGGFKIFGWILCVDDVGAETLATLPLCLWKHCNSEKSG